MYQIITIQEKKKFGPGTHYVKFPVQGAEILAMVFKAHITNASAGIPGTPVAPSLETSWDKGTSWDAINYFFQDWNGNGVFEGRPSATTGRISPLARIKFIVPAGESLELELFKPVLDMRDAYGYQSSDLSMTATTGFVLDGIGVGAEINSGNPALNLALPMSLHGGQGEPALAVDAVFDTAHLQAATRKALPTIALNTAFDAASSQRRELTMESTDQLRVSEGLADAVSYFHRVYATDPVTAPTVIGVTAGVHSGFQIFDSSGIAYLLTFGALEFVVPPGGLYMQGVRIPDATTITATPIGGENLTTGEFIINLTGLKV